MTARRSREGEALPFVQCERGRSKVSLWGGYVLRISGGYPGRTCSAQSTSLARCVTPERHPLWGAHEPGLASEHPGQTCSAEDAKREPNPDNLPPVPKARPSTWWYSCDGCGKKGAAAAGVRVACLGEDLRGCGETSNTALWGHEWAAVAWLALSEAHLEGVFKDTGECLQSTHAHDRAIEPWMQRNRKPLEEKGDAP